MGPEWGCCSEALLRPIVDMVRRDLTELINKPPASVGSIT